jgi:thiol-disulfide isomerase/thioredoxin
MNRFMRWKTLGSLFLLVASGVCCISFGQEPVTSDDSKKSQHTLQIGDEAPELVVDQWLGGEPIGKFARGNVYVVEFWATWCGPCIKSMPHLNELAQQYADEGLVVIAITNADEANTKEAVEKFIQGPGKDFEFRFAYCEGGESQQAYMVASGQVGIPCSFVVDRAGKLAYVGLPHDLDYVLERVIKGQWRGKADAEELLELNNSISKLGQLVEEDPAKALQLVEHVYRVNPKRTEGMDFAYAAVVTFCKVKMFDRAKAVIDAMCDKSKPSIDWGAVAMVSGTLASAEMNPDGVHRAEVVQNLQAAEEELKGDWQNLMQVALGYQMAGQPEKFQSCMEQVINLCPDEQIKTSLRTVLERQLLPPDK